MHLVWLLAVLTSQAPPSCPNTCVGAGAEFANDGECDDGGPGAKHSICAFGAYTAPALALARSPAPHVTSALQNPIRVRVCASPVLEPCPS